MTSVMWFRRDLRLEDNTALYHAFEDSDEVILLFQVNPKQFLKDSTNQHAFFASVAHFQTAVNKKLHLQILYGDLEESFGKLKENLENWDRIYFNYDERGFGAERDQKMREFFKKNNIVVHDYMDHHLHGAKEIKNQSGDPYKVYTPYYNQWKQLAKPTPVKVKLSSEKVVKDSLFAEDEKKFEELCKDLPDKSFYKLGSKAAKQQLEHFLLEDVVDYTKARDIPAQDRTSRLSPYLRTGEISIRTVWQQLQETENSAGKQTFEKELCWRDFYNMIYAANPKQKQQPIQTNFQFIQWSDNQDHLKKWQEGKTGYPIVDAAMRQLNQTGWMHNRLRMIVASFLTKDLLIDWREGEKYFQKSLIDYDPASNIGGWQWGASTGTDAVPYFRIFNPTTQSERFDASGDFIRKYVPELKDLPKKFIHQPDKMSEDEQAEYGVLLGEDYPSPIVNHKEARRKALSAYEGSREFAKEVPESE
ncbi:cryptochrome/photolyase family protein [Candidatus Enterococcus ferrettii]|uniref:Deoxyribodipyrimidine photo-lyase n=1 Tax=Candidatus Enterococcus ferrettii TaxID=2815324 RepID=A0ABV0EPV6_9ENTE|nr:deoxyribodipyrimidine photo-lyase [Enterococcus sp. 665A]MBO1341149.1 deoxyribodipyrimidine photo-lyase [Enterococcus sp. 665A]